MLIIAFLSSFEPKNTRSLVQYKNYGMEMPWHVLPAAAWRGWGGVLKILEKYLLGTGWVRNFYFGGVGSWNFEGKFKIA